VSHHPTSKHQCTRLSSVSNLNSQASNPINSIIVRPLTVNRAILAWLFRLGTEPRRVQLLSGYSRPAFKDYRDLYAGVCLWLMRAWVQIPFAAIFADIPRGWFKLRTFSLLFSIIHYGHFETMFFLENLLRRALTSFLGGLQWPWSGSDLIENLSNAADWLRV